MTDFIEKCTLNGDMGLAQTADMHLFIFFLPGKKHIFK